MFPALCIVLIVFFAWWVGRCGEKEAQIILRQEEQEHVVDLPSSCKRFLSHEKFSKSEISTTAASFGGSSDIYC